MSAPLRHPVIPVGEVRQETVPRINSTVPCALHGAECNWPACDPSCAGRPGNPEPEVEYIDLTVLDHLPEATVAAITFDNLVSVVAAETARAEDEYLAGDYTAHRRAWEGRW